MWLFGHVIAREAALRRREPIEYRETFGRNANAGNGLEGNDEIYFGPVWRPEGEDYALRERAAVWRRREAPAGGSAGSADPFLCFRSEDARVPGAFCRTLWHQALRALYQRHGCMAHCIGCLWDQAGRPGHYGLDYGYGNLLRHSAVR